MKRLSCLLSVLLSVFLLSAYYPGNGNGFHYDGMVIPIGNEIYELMDSLFILEGKGLPSTSRPWTVSEAKNELGKLDKDSLSSESFELYKEIDGMLAYEKENDISLTVSFSPEMYAHTNDTYNREELWNYGYEDRNHMFRVSLDNSTGGFYGHLELSGGIGVVSGEDAASRVTLKSYVENNLGKDWNGVGSEYPADDEELSSIYVITNETNYSKNFVINAPSGSNTDMNMPRRAYLDYAGSNFSVGFYKAQKEWGNNSIGNFIFDRHHDYYDTLTLKTFSPDFSFEYTWMFPETYPGGKNGYSDSNPKSRRIFLAHRLEFRAFDRLSVTLSENVMYRFSSLPDIPLMNPAFFYHNNVNNGQFNALAHVEVAYSILSGLLVYGQFSLDQGSFPGFEDPTTEDQAVGMSLGLEWNGYFKKGIISTVFEALYTTPALYRPSGSSDFIIHYNHLDVNDYYRYPFFTYIGYEEGGDTIELLGRVSYRKNSLYLYSKADLRIKGEYGMYDEYHIPIALSTPSGKPVSTLTLNTGVEKKFNVFGVPLVTFLDIAAVIDSSRGFDMQFSLGASVSYSLI